MTYFQAIVIGILQGVSELFPVSSLGHSVLIPGLIGWNNLVSDQSAKESLYLAFIVGLHVATAGALLAFFWRDWIRIIARVLPDPPESSDRDARRNGWRGSSASRPFRSSLTGLLFEHTFRTIFAKPEAAAFFLDGSTGSSWSGAELLRRRRTRA